MKIMKTKQKTHSRCGMNRAEEVLKYDIHIYTSSDMVSNNGLADPSNLYPTSCPLGTSFFLTEYKVFFKAYGTLLT